MKEIAARSAMSVSPLVLEPPYVGIATFYRSKDLLAKARKDDMVRLEVVVEVGTLGACSSTSPPCSPSAEKLVSRTLRCTR